MDIPGFGTFEYDDRDEWWASAEDAEITVPALDLTGRLIVQTDELTGDLAPDRIAATAQRFVALSPAQVEAITPYLWAYYTDTRTFAERDGYDVVAIASPQEVWQHVDLGDEFRIEADDDGTLYVSLESECEWAVEHGLHLAFRNGDEIATVGPYDGSLLHPDREVYSV